MTSEMTLSWRAAFGELELLLHPEEHSVLHTSSLCERESGALVSYIPESLQQILINSLRLFVF